MDRLGEDVLKQRNYSHVLILFGNNDCWLMGPNQPKISIENFRKNMVSVAKQIEDNGQTPVFCNLQPIDFVRFSKLFPELLEYRKKMEWDPSALQKKYSGEVESLAQAGKYACVDIRSNLERSSEEVIAQDGIHPNDLGHRLIADVILAFLRAIDPSMALATMEKR